MAKRSGGPRTPEGKRASSRNSLKVGAYSAIAVLPNESQEDFDRLLAQVSQDLKPADLVEIALVHDLAVITWKKLRLERLEHAYFLKKLGEPITQEELASCGITMSDDRHHAWLDSIDRPEPFLAELDEMGRMAKKISPYLYKKIPAKLLGTMCEEHPKLRFNLIQNYRANITSLDAEPSLEAIASLVTSAPESDVSRYFTGLVFEDCIASFKDREWLVKHQQKITAAVQAIKAERLLKLSLMEGGHRAGEDLRRAFARALSELRRQQGWRAAGRLIDEPKD